MCQIEMATDGEKSKELVLTCGNAEGSAFQVVYPAITSSVSRAIAADIDAQLALAVEEEKKVTAKQYQAISLFNEAQEMMAKVSAETREKRSEVIRLQQAKYIASLPSETELKQEEADILSRLKVAQEKLAPALEEVKHLYASVNALEAELAEVGKKLRAVCTHQYKTEFGGHSVCVKCRSNK